MLQKYDGQLSSKSLIKGAGDVTFHAEKQGDTGENYFKKLTGTVGMPDAAGDDSTNRGYQLSQFNDADSDNETLY